jgi:hypothetical protein
MTTPKIYPCVERARMALVMFHRKTLFSGSVTVSSVDECKEIQSEIPLAEIETMLFNCREAFETINKKNMLSWDKEIDELDALLAKLNK